VKANSVDSLSANYVTSFYCTLPVIHEVR
jgi:hypothetical protein